VAKFSFFSLPHLPCTEKSKEIPGICLLIFEVCGIIILNKLICIHYKQYIIIVCQTKIIWQVQLAKISANFSRKGISQDRLSKNAD